MIQRPAVAIAQLAACWMLTAHAALATPSGLMTLATIALAGMIVVSLACNARIASAVTPPRLTGLVTAQRRKAWGAVFQRQLNPDTAGRPRPRAPSAVPAAA